MASDFVQFLREKYPEMKDASDADIAKFVTEKMPQYADKVKNVAPERHVPGKFDDVAYQRGMKSATEDIKKRTKLATGMLPIAGATAGSLAGPIGTGLGAVAGQNFKTSVDSLFDPTVAAAHAGVSGALTSAKESVTTGVVAGVTDWGAGVIFKGVGALGRVFGKKWAEVKGVKQSAESLGIFKAKDITKENVIEAVTKFVGRSSKEGAEQVKQTIGTLKDADIGIEKVFESDAAALAEVGGDKARVSSDVVRNEFNRLVAPSAATKKAEVVAESLKPKESVFVSEMRKDIEGLPNMDLHRAQILKSRWLLKGAAEGEEALAAAKKAAKALDEGMLQAAGKVNPAFKRQVQEMITAHGDAADLMRATVFPKLMKSDAASVVKSITNSAEANQLKEALTRYGGKDGKAAWEQFQALHGEKFLDNFESAINSLKDKETRRLIESVHGSDFLSRMDAAAKAFEYAKEPGIASVLMRALHLGVSLPHGHFYLFTRATPEAAGAISGKVMYGIMNNEKVARGFISSIAQAARKGSVAIATAAAERSASMVVPNKPVAAEATTR